LSAPDEDTAPDFYTVGYSGCDIDGFVHRLSSAGVACLIDIRYNAVSMYKPAFSRKNLETSLNEAGIEYLHMPDLGVPSDIRGLATISGRRDDIWDWYEANVLPQYSANLHWFFNSTNHPIALMCVEKDPEDCHRHLLADALERRGLHSADL
jgi:uncharacterized protein (DUF488 family)